MHISWVQQAKISDADDVKKSDVQNAEIIFLEGYLWDEGDPKKAFDKAIAYTQREQLCLYLILFCVQ